MITLRIYHLFVLIHQIRLKELPQLMRVCFRGSFQNIISMVITQLNVVEISLRDKWAEVPYDSSRLYNLLYIVHHYRKR